MEFLFGFGMVFWVRILTRATKKGTRLEGLGRFRM